MKHILAVVIGILAVIVVSLSIYLQPNDFKFCPLNNKPITREGCDAADAIVAVSGGDTAARTNHAIQLYKNGWAPLLIFSGAAQDKTGLSNALAMRQIAIEAGVPSEAILIEENSENTAQNASLTSGLVASRGIKNIILVTSGYHQRRASLEFHTQLSSSGVVIRNSPTDDSDWNWYWWLTPRGWWLAIGEFVKIIVVYSGANPQ